MYSESFRFVYEFRTRYVKAECFVSIHNYYYCYCDNDNNNIMFVFYDSGKL
jgi:hypothetical protein